MRIAIALGVALLAGVPAHAGQRSYQEGFIGWSADGTFYAMTWSGTDEYPVPVLCLTKHGVASPTWPKSIPAPDPDDETGCSQRWNELFPNDDPSIDKMAAKAAAFVVATGAFDRGPGGETVTVKRVDGEIIEIAVMRKGKRIARDSIALKFASMALPDQVLPYWRKDRGAVAIALNWSPDPNAIGFGPPSWVLVLPLDGSTANAELPKSKRQQAKALNIEGMKSLTAKQLDKAQEQFTKATEADDSYMLAYYNLACTASLRKDRATSIKALKTLASSDDKDAKAYLAKGLTDHDLDWIGDDPEGAKILKRKAKK